MWAAVWSVVLQPDWYRYAGSLTFVMGFGLSMPGALRGREGFSIAALFGAGCATVLVTDPLGWGQWRLLLLIPALVVAFLSILTIVGLQATTRRWWRVLRGRPTQADARAMVSKAMADEERAAQVGDALSRAPGDPHAGFYQYFRDWPGRTSVLTPRTAVRWLRSGESPDRLWQMLCVGISEDRIVAYLDGSDPVDWSAVETLAALRAAAV